MSDLNCIFIQGVAGVGKSSVSKLLAEKTGWTLIDRDAVGTSSIEDKDTERATAYENLARRAAEELGRGNRIVVDAPFLKEYQENTFTDWIDSVVSLVIKDIRHFELHYKAIWLSANQDKRKERRISRAAKRDSRITDWDAELQKEDSEYLRPPGVLEIPTDSVLPDQIVEVIDWLGIGERKLRKATRADVMSIASIKESRIQDTFSFLSPVELQREIDLVCSMEAVEKMFDDLVYIAEDPNLDPSVRAVGALRIDEDDRGRVAHLYSGYSYGAGAGSALMSQGISEAEHHGISRFSTNIFENNLQGQGIARRWGFLPCGDVYPSSSAPTEYIQKWTKDTEFVKSSF